VKNFAAMLVGVFLLVGCTPSGPPAPSTEQKRACEMYLDARGDLNPPTLAYWVEHFSKPEQIAAMKKSNAENKGNPFITQDTPQSAAERQFAFGSDLYSKAKASVSMRLAISLREVDEALEKCRNHKGGRP
jgi:hypothetical protein